MSALTDILNASYHFAYQWVLFFLLGVPLWLWLQNKKTKAAALTFSSTEIFKEIPKAAVKRPGKPLLVLRALALSLLIIAAARPQKGEGSRSDELKGIDIILLIDISGSMLALDFSKGNTLVTRLDVVKKAVSDFIEARKNDRLGVVAFAGLPYLASPLTLNHDWVQKTVDRLRVKLVEDGTAIGTAIAMGANHLKDISSKSRVIILLTDGANNSGNISPLAAAEAASAFGIKIYTIAIGQASLVPTLIADEKGNILTNRRGEPIIQQANFDVDFNVLQKIATLTQGQSFEAKNKEALSDIYQTINKLETSPAQLTRFVSYNELFWIPALLALIILMAEYALSRSRYRIFP